MDRGDIWRVELDPVEGREQARFRPVLVLTPRAFNALGTPVVAPVATVGDFARARGFAVSLMGAGTATTGIVLCHQIRALDLRARGGRFVERAPREVVEEVLARVATLFE